MFVKDIIQEYSVRNRENHAYPVYSVTNSQGFCKDYFGKEVASKDKSTYKIVPYGYFAYNPSRINVGSIDWQHCEDYVIVSPLYNVFKVNTNLVSQDYLSYYFKSSLVSTYINALAKGTVRLNIPLGVLGNFPIPVPSIAEQERIVAELDLLSGIIEKKKEQLKAYGQLAQSIFYTMFGDPISNEKGWKVKTLSDVCGITSPLVDPQQYPYSEMLHVSPSNIISGTGEMTKCPLTNEEFLISNKYTFTKEMVLYSKIRPNLNKVATPNFDGICSADMYPLTIKSNASKIYVKHLLLGKSFLEYAIKHSGRARMPKINREALFAYSFPLPPLSLQQEFAEKVEAIEHQKALIQQSIEETQTMFDYTMDKYFG